LYLETLEQVLGANNTVLLDVPGGDSLMYLPLDQLIGKSKRSQASNSDTSRPNLSAPTTAGTRTPDLRTRDTSRERRSR
jgi:membrane protease subunit HflK